MGVAAIPFREEALEARYVRRAGSDGTSKEFNQRLGCRAFRRMEKIVFGAPTGRTERIRCGATAWDSLTAQTLGGGRMGHVPLLESDSFGHRIFVDEKHSEWGVDPLGIGKASRPKRVS